MTVISTTITAADANAAPGFSGSPSQGVTRVQLGTGNDAPAALPGRGSTAQDFSSVQRVNVAELGVGNDISARSPIGRPLAPSEVQPDSLVTVGGITMKAAQAERLGLLTKDVSGYRSAAQSAPTSATQHAQEATKEDPQATPAPTLSGDAAASLEALNAGGDDTMKAATEYLDAGELSPTATARLAGRLGIEPEQVQQHVANVAEGFHAQAVELVGGAEVLDLAYHIDPAQAARVARDHALKGDVSGYAALAAKVTEHVVTNAASVESVDGDIRVRTVSGRHLVSGAGIPGEVDLRQAVKLGLVSVTVQR